MKKNLRIFSYCFPKKKTIAALLITAAVTSAATVAAPFLSGVAIDLIRDEGDSNLSALFHLLAVLGVVFLVTALSQWILSLLTVRLANSTAQRLRNETFKKLHRLPLSFFDTTAHGDILSRMTNDVDTLTDGLLQGSTRLLTGVLTLIGSFIFMFFLNPMITIVIVLLAIFSVWTAAFISKNSTKQFRNQALCNGKLTALTEEVLSGLETVKQFEQENCQMQRFREINAELYHYGREAQFYSSLTNPSTRLINNTAYAAIGILGGLLALRGALSVGQIAGFLTYAVQFAKPINEMTAVLYQLQAAQAAAERVFDLKETAAEPEESPQALTLTQVRGAVSAEKLFFSYSRDRKLIENLSFSVQPGQTIAIVGPSGAGKTTLINLLMRFYEIDSGRLFLDGIDLSDCTKHSLRSSFALVLQETWLFKGTIRENIGYGKPGASAAEIETAAIAANADPFIRCLPSGYETVIDEGGSNLSQGQQQMLTIARAMLKSAPLLILDEATSNVDTRTELKIQEAFLRLMKNKTCFLIAHRLSTVRNADFILVMDKGNVVEKGTHRELIEADGLYAQMYRQ